jgi:hypothetical protein
MGTVARVVAILVPAMEVVLVVITMLVGCFAQYLDIGSSEI